MSDILEKFNVFSEFSEEFKRNIKLFHVFDGKYVLFVTKEDKVFAFGSNFVGILGFGHSNSVFRPKEIPELNGKQIKQFFFGFDFVLALNEENHVFGWGYNRNGQLGRGYKSGYYEYLKPEIIPNLENIIEISCGDLHCLALNKEYNVFSWGRNIVGQVGFGKQSGEYITRPVQLKFYGNNSWIKNFLKELPKIKSIHCSEYKSFAVTSDGLVYSWGDNSGYCLGHKSRDNIFEPKLIIGLNNVISLGSSYKYLNYNLTYFLTKEGNIYFCGQINSREYQKIPKILETDLKFQSLQTIYYNYSLVFYDSEVLALSEETVYSLEKNLIKKTEYKTFHDYFLNERQITMNTIEIKELNFSERFQELSGLGSGGFGQVCKYKDKSDNTIYAVKKIIQTDKSFDELKKEVDLLKKCNSKYVVKYFESKLENNCFYIIMELMDNNLDQIIKEMKNGRIQSKEMFKIEYFICSHLMKELLECVQYLHQLKPPIIHRDLKPANILVSYEPKNNRFLKICDFGISTLGSDITISHTRWKGTPEYTAPEVWNGIIGTSGSKVKYSTKADVYSLGKIINRLFDFKFFSSDKTEELNLKLTELEKLTQQMMMNPDYNQRPTCKQILEKSDLWLIKKNQLNVKSIEEYENSFIKSYLKYKFNEDNSMS